MINSSSFNNGSNSNSNSTVNSINKITKSSSLRFTLPPSFSKSSLSSAATSSSPAAEKVITISVAQGSVGNKTTSFTLYVTSSVGISTLVRTKKTILELANKLNVSNCPLQQQQPEADEHSLIAVKMSEWFTFISKDSKLAASKYWAQFLRIKRDDLISLRPINSDQSRPVTNLRHSKSDLIHSSGNKKFSEFDDSSNANSSEDEKDLKSKIGDCFNALEFLGPDPVEASQPAAASTATVRKRRKIQISDFDLLRVLGKGCAGKVLLCTHRDTSKLYAVKCIHKRHVLAHQELAHTLTEQSVLKSMAGTDPFVITLRWSFHDAENLFLVMDFHPGGDLATQLSRWGRLGRDRARFYAAEIVEGVEGLHKHGIIYRDLKPENILIGADGHVVLTDFGLSKQFLDHQSREGASTSTFCGTAEYLAPEVIQGLPYSYSVDWWSLGTMIYEMLAGITPFWANNHSDMYIRVLHDDLVFPEERSMDQDTRNLIRGLLCKDPALRLCEPRIKNHAYFSLLDWSHVHNKRYIPPYIPPTMSDNDTQNFDDSFLALAPTYVDEETKQAIADDAEKQAEVARVLKEAEDTGNDLWDGYSYRAQPDTASVLLNEALDEVMEGKDVAVQNSTEQNSKRTANTSHKHTHRREKSGIPILDQRLDEHGSSEKNEEGFAGSDTEDNDWDLMDEIEADQIPMERNGVRREGSRLNIDNFFSRGIMDQYTLGALRKKEIQSSHDSGSGFPSSAAGLDNFETPPATLDALNISTPKPERKKGRLSFGGGFSSVRRKKNITVSGISAPSSPSRQMSDSASNISNMSSSTSITSSGEHDVPISSQQDTIKVTPSKILKKDLFSIFR